VESANALGPGHGLIGIDDWLGKHALIGRRWLWWTYPHLVEQQCGSAQAILGFASEGQVIEHERGRYGGGPLPPLADEAHLQRFERILVGERQGSGKSVLVHLGLAW
jgi:hypothetical protein